MLKVTIDPPSSARASVAVFDRGMASLTFQKGVSFGLVARRQGDEVIVMVVLLSGTLGQNGGSVQQIGLLHLPLQTPVAMAHEGVQMHVEWGGTRRSSVAGPESTPDRARECTITCGRVVVTAAAVETTCGRCCDPTACGR